MSLQDYLEQKRRNIAKKELRRTKPYLNGVDLEMEIDRVLGVADSGKMDWVSIVESGKQTSDYPTPESIKYEDILEVSSEFKMRPYLLYWFFAKKISAIKASGRSKSDYKEFLKSIAVSSLKKELSSEEKAVAAIKYASDLKNVTITQNEAEIMIIQGKI